MITKDDIVEIGKFLKTHALKGELNAVLDIDMDYAEDGNPLIVEMDGIFVPFFAESVRPKGTEACLIKLRDVDSQEKATEFVNKIIYGDRKDLLNYYDDPEAEFVDDMVGLKVIDTRLGEIGDIIEVDDTTANVLLHVKSPGGKLIYIPLAEEFIVAIDPDEKIMETDLPDGLIDLNP